MSAQHNHCDHHHSHIPQDKKALRTSFLIIGGFMLVELIGGYLFNSLVLTADAGHMANDAISLGLALFALHIATKNKKLEQKLALINGISLIVIALYIIYEAIERLNNPLAMIPLPMIAVAVVGLLVNIVVMRIMMNANQENLNIRAAYLHVLADLLGSVTAIVSGLAVYWFGWIWVDPAASLLLSLIILRSGGQVSLAALKALHDNGENDVGSRGHDH